MIQAYSELYLSRAQSVLGSMLEYAVYDLEMPLDVFYKRFVVSSFAERFQRGESTIIAGKSGVELVFEILGSEKLVSKNRINTNRSPEYWIGWSLAYFQWKTNLSFARIEDSIPITEIAKMYSSFHEMDITQVFDYMLELYRSRNLVSNLKKLRQRAGLSQSELAVLSQVPVRTIQQYEQRQKNINAAKAETVIRIAKYLYCSVEDIMELQ